MKIRGVFHATHSANWPRRRQLVWRYIDEGSVFLILVAAIVVSDLATRSRHRVQFSWVRLAACFIAAISLYGSMHSQWRVTKGAEPPWFKRAVIAASYGISSDTIAAWIG